MRCFRWATLCCGLLSLAQGGCLVFDDDINQRPEVTVMAPAGPAHRGQVHVFTASAHDPDQAPETLRFAWATATTPCGEKPWERAKPGPGQAGRTSFSYQTKTLGRHCVWVGIADAQGAEAMAFAEIEVLNRVPTAGLTTPRQEKFAAQSAAAPVPLYSKMRIDGSQSADDDDDSLQYHWTLTRPGETAETTSACPDEQSALCLQLDAPGSYVVGLTVSDDPGAVSAPVEQTIVVAEDQSPCLVETFPAIDDSFSPPGAATFSVVVQDDGDPLPAQEGASQAVVTWSWRLAKDEVYARVIGSTGRTLTLPASVGTLGNEVWVRASVQDRMSDRAGMPCEDENKICNSRPGCVQRTVWRVRFQ